MAMRYIFRRENPSDFSDVQKQVTNLSEQLGIPGENYRRFVKVSFSNDRYAQFTFFTEKKDTNWIWTCPSVELVAENEKGLFSLTDHFKMGRPAHLAHLPG